MIERDQVMFGIVWPTLAATAVLLGLWWRGSRDARAPMFARLAGALAIAAATIVAATKLLGGVSFPPSGVGPAVIIAAGLSAAIALVTARGMMNIALGGMTGLLAAGAVAWPWLAAGRERTAHELVILASMVGAGAVFAALTRAITASAQREPLGWISLGLAFGAVAGTTAPLLVIGGAWLNAGLVAGAASLALFSSFLMTMRTGSTRHELAASIATISGVLPALWLASHLGSELPWWTGVMIALTPVGWFAGSLEPFARRGGRFQVVARVAGVAIIALTALILAISPAPLDSYLQ